MIQIQESCQKRLDKSMQPLTCECGKSFESTQALGMHRNSCKDKSNLSAASNDSVTPSQKSQISSSQFEPVVCCGVRCVTPAGLSRHVRSGKHQQMLKNSLASQPLTYPCENCNEEFEELSHLTVHSGSCK